MIFLNQIMRLLFVSRLKVLLIILVIFLDGIEILNFSYGKKLSFT